VTAQGRSAVTDKGRRMPAVVLAVTGLHIALLAMRTVLYPPFTRPDEVFHPRPHRLIRKTPRSRRPRVSRVPFPSVPAPRFTVQVRREE